jgi:hypothetical protein
MVAGTAIAAGYYFQHNPINSASSVDGIALTAPIDSDATIAEAFSQHKNNVQVAGAGTVKKLLPQDNKGSRHQKFIIKLASGQTLLIAHNIDLAPGINSLREGDAVSFFGEYEWSPQGGVIHWTHRDPKGHHIDGWLKHRGQIYQ